MGFIYILKCSGKRTKTVLYIGMTKREFTERFEEHRSGKSKYTSKFSEIEAVWVREFPDRFLRKIEIYLKKHRKAAEYLAGKISKKGRTEFEKFMKFLGELGLCPNS